MVSMALQRAFRRERSLVLAPALGLGLLLAVVWALSPAAPQSAHAAPPGVDAPALHPRQGGQPVPLDPDRAPTTDVDLPAGLKTARLAAVQEQVSSGISPTASWSPTGEGNYDFFANAVASAGDVNGDGYGDVVVGAFGYDASGSNLLYQGRMYVYHGGIDGLSVTPAFTATGEGVPDRFGVSVAKAGDVNGDGYDDVIAGAWGHSSERGALYVYYGSAAGISDTSVLSIAGENPNDWFGAAVASAGDVNGDGYADVVVGAEGYDRSPTVTNTGKVYVYHGGSGGLSATPAFSATGDSLEGLASSVACAGDLNGDGYADLVVGSEDYDGDRGRIYVAYGSAAGVAASNVFSTTGEHVGDGLGSSVGPAGDVNGDGYADLVAGASGYDSDRGALYVYYGSSGGMSSSSVFSTTGEGFGDQFGHSSTTAGDVNGDGYADLVVGARRHTISGGDDEGKAYVYYGAGGGITSTAAFTAVGESTNDYLGACVAGAGDVNGDGYADIIIGADRYGLYQGKAYAYHGGGDGLVATPAFTATGESAENYFGDQVATAGDVDGDGYTDLVVGASGYNTCTGKAYVYHGGPSGLSTTPAFTATGENEGDYFGQSVGTAGDVNGDGYADLVVGAYGYDSERGSVFVYHGGSAGLSATPAFTATGEATGEYFGASAASAGDVNGDGYADVVVGAYYHDVSPFGIEGKVYVYHGSATGLIATPAFTVTGQDDYDYLGDPVAGAGDVNGDGYADIVVCAGRFAEAGLLQVHHGSASGLSAAPAFTATYGENSDFFCSAVSTAGDVNGDGYADLVVGAYGYDSERGSVFVYHGGSAGLSAAPAFTATGEMTGERFGGSVASAGDVNGDGYADVVVGAWGYDANRGRFYLFYGGSAGLSQTDVCSITGQMNDYLGEAVATAGDVDGDGFADVAVGSPERSSGRGMVTVYPGGGGGGRLLQLWQVRSSTSGARVQPWAMALGLYVRANGFNPLGRNRVKLQVEACPPGVAFGDAGCVAYTSATWQDTTADAYGVPIKEAVGGLSGETLYRWRARLLYAPYSVTEGGITPPPNPTHGPWRRLFGQALEADLRTGRRVYLPLALRNFP